MPAPTYAEWPDAQEPGAPPPRKARLDRASARGGPRHAWRLRRARCSCARSSKPSSADSTPSSTGAAGTNSRTATPTRPPRSSAASPRPASSRPTRRRTTCSCSARAWSRRSRATGRARRSGTWTGRSPSATCYPRRPRVRGPAGRRQHVPPRPRPLRQRRPPRRHRVQAPGQERVGRGGHPPDAPQPEAERHPAPLPHRPAHPLRPAQRSAVRHRRHGGEVLVRVEGARGRGRRAPAHPGPWAGRVRAMRAGPGAVVAPPPASPPGADAPFRRLRRRREEGGSLPAVLRRQGDDGAACAARRARTAAGRRHLAHAGQRQEPDDGDARQGARAAPATSGAPAS